MLSNLTSTMHMLELRLLLQHETRAVHKFQALKNPTAFQKHAVLLRDILASSRHFLAYST
jgi:hypothetical protein